MSSARPHPEAAGASPGACREGPTVRVRSRPALSVSARHGKAFVLGGRLLGHVLDPRRGEPAGAAHSACVVGPTSTVCDALSTALLVKGAVGRAELAERFPGYSGWVATALEPCERAAPIETGAEATVAC